MIVARRESSFVEQRGVFTGAVAFALGGVHEQAGVFGDVQRAVFLRVDEGIVNDEQIAAQGVNRIAVSRLWDISIALELPVGRFFDGLATRGVAEANRSAGLQQSTR